MNCFYCENMSYERYKSYNKAYICKKYNIQLAYKKERLIPCEHCKNEIITT